MKAKDGKDRYILVITILCICLLGALYMLVDNNIGVRNNSDDIGVEKDEIEADARFQLSIPETWSVQIETGDVLSAMIFYPSDSSDAIYHIYLKREGTVGYFPRATGKLVSVKNGITRFYLDGYSEFAYISLNKIGICRLEIDDGDCITTIDLDRTKPFALILPSNSGNVYFYNEAGEIVQYTDRKL